MCFSEEASFIACGVLACASLAISRIPKEKDSLPLSLIPAVFAAHQFIEGFIWLNQDKVNLDALKSTTVLLYVMIAFVFWPIFIPYASYRLETERKQRILILICQAVGLGVGLTYFLSMLQSPVDVSVNACSLSYPIQTPVDLIAPYLLAVSIPFLVSSRRGLALFGIAVLCSCAAAFYLASQPSFPSVWCFFAAFLSGSLYLYFRFEARIAERQPVTRALVPNR